MSRSFGFEKLAALTVTVLVTVLVPLSSNAQEGPGPWRTNTVEKVPHGKWKGKRLPDGQPDIQGHWSNTIANHDNFTDPQAGIPGDPAGLGGGSAQGLSTPRRPARPPREQRAPSRVSDPADGQVPFQPWARAKQEELLANFFDPKKPEHIE
ncbi:MAG: hypothetical protein JNL55_35035, partial [Steroidobacter sp.]